MTSGRSHGVFIPLTQDIWLDISTMKVLGKLETQENRLIVQSRGVNVNSAEFIKMMNLNDNVFLQIELSFQMPSHWVLPSPSWPPPKNKNVLWILNRHYDDP